MRQVKLQNKLNKVSSKPEEKTMKDSPRIVSKLTRYEKFVPNEKAPEKMKTRPASPVPSKDLPSKLNAAVKKAKELGISNDKPKVKGTGAASSYQPSKAANNNAIRYRATPATVSKPSASTPKGQNVPMGSGSKSKPSSSESSSRYKIQK